MTEHRTPKEIQRDIEPLLTEKAAVVDRYLAGIKRHPDRDLGRANVFFELDRDNHRIATAIVKLYEEMHASITDVEPYASWQARAVAAAAAHYREEARMSAELVTAHAEHLDHLVRQLGLPTREDVA